MACPGLSYPKLAGAATPAEFKHTNRTDLSPDLHPLHVAPLKAVTSSVPNVFIGEHRCVEL